jgi:hypothetical protein
MVTQTNPNSLKNLEKGIKMTSEIAKENQKKSTEAKRLKKTMRETLEILLQDVVSVDGAPKNCQEAILASAVNKAMQGDIKAMEFIRDTIGQKPVDNINTTATTITRYITQEETQETNKHIDDVINGTR